MRPLAALIVMLAGLGLAGCDAGDDPAATGSTPTSSLASPSSIDAPAPTPARLPAPLTVEWTGGIDGRHITVTVRPDGSWTRSERRDGSVLGYLDADRLAEVARLATSADLRDEARRAASFRPRSQCADVVGIRLTMADLVVAMPASFCGDLKLPVLSRIAELLNDATRRSDR